MNEYKLDVNGMPMGRAASEVAKLIIGKNKTDYAPNKLSDAIVVVSNVDKLSFSGRKLIQKKYYTHSGYIGNLKEKSLEDKFEVDPKKLFTQTVKGMLPHNRLGSQMIKKLRYE